MNSPTNSFFKALKGRLRMILPLSAAIALLVAALQVKVSPGYFADITILADRITSGIKGSVQLLRPSIAELRRRHVEVRKTDGWRIDKGFYLYTGNRPGELHLKGYFPEEQSILFPTTTLSGRVKITINGISTKMISLQSPVPGIETVDLNEYLSGKKRFLFPFLAEYFTAFLTMFFVTLPILLVIHPVYVKLDSYVRTHAPRNLSQSHSLAEDRPVSQLLLLLAFLFFGCFALAFFPGVLNLDSYLQYIQAVRWQFNDWHPPIMAVVWNVTNRIIPESGGIFLLHLSVMVYSLYLLSRVAFLRGKRFFVLPLFAIFLPFVSCFLFNIIKDVSMAVSLLLAFSLWYSGRSNGNVNLSRAVLVLFLVFYGCSVRLNGLPAVLPLLFVFLADYTTKAKALLVSLFLGVVLYAGNHVLVYRILQTNPRYLSQSIMAHDLMGVYAITRTNYFPVEYLTRQTLDELMKNFDHWSLDRTTFGEDRFMTRNYQVFQALKKNWFRAILAQPEAYLIHRWLLFKSFLTEPVYAIQPVSSQVPSGARGWPRGLIKETHLGTVHTLYVNWTLTHCKFLYAAITYFVLSILLFLFSVKQRMLTPAALSLSSLAYIVPYFFFAPAPSFRYSYWPIFATLLCFYVIWIEKYGVYRTRADE